MFAEPKAEIDLEVIRRRSGLPVFDFITLAIICIRLVDGFCKLPGLAPSYRRLVARP
jgi:hypothetical protein